MCGGIKDKPGFAASYDLPMSFSRWLKFRNVKLCPGLKKLFLVIRQGGGLNRAAFKPSLARCGNAVHFVLPARIDTGQTIIPTRSCHARRAAFLS
jgi:hypothetical protein